MSTDATLGAHHDQVTTAADAARGLEPLAGPAAAALFGLGLLASALLALPVIAMTSAYALAEALGWKADIDARFREAPRFYVAMFIVLGAGAAIGLSGISPIALLYWGSIAGGLATPVTLALMMRASADRRVMGTHRLGRNRASPDGRWSRS